MRRSTRMSRPTLSGSSRSAVLLGNDGDGSTLTLDFTTGVLDPRLTFTRASGGTYTGNDGLVYGMDFATSSSLAIGTGSKSVTLTATAGVDRRYLIGQTVWISNGANNMSGPVTAYNASTQVLTINATATSGSGSFTSWAVGNASPRFDYDPTTLAPRGLLIEGAATNLLQQSAAVRTSPWSEGGLTTAGTSITAPDGTSNGVELVGLNGQAYGNAYTYQQITASATNVYTMSVFLKAKGTAINTQVAMQARAGATQISSVLVNFNNSNGTVGSVNSGTWTTTSATSTPIGNGWYRITLTGISPATTDNIRAFILASSTANGTDGAYVWGAQVEAGAGASSYIPTGASQVQRLADECSMTGTNFSSWWPNPTAEFTVLWTGDITRIPPASAQFIWLSRASGTSKARAYVTTGSVIRANSSVFDFTASPATTATANTVFKSAMAVKSGDSAMYVNSGSVIGSQTDASTGTTTNHDSLYFNPNADNFMHIRVFKFWPTRLSNATLQGLVS